MTNENRRNETLATIALAEIGVTTLETQKSDERDFHDVAVWTLKAALEAAFEAGRNAR